MLCANMISWLAFLLRMGHTVSISPATLESHPPPSSSAIPTWSALAQAGPSGPPLDSHCPCAVPYHNWCHSALSISVCESVSPLDYELFEVGNWLICVCNYTSQQKHVYNLECPRFSHLHAFAYAIPPWEYFPPLPHSNIRQIQEVSSQMPPPRSFSR